MTTTTCPHCGTSNPGDSRFCQHCGKPLTASAIAGQDPTIRWTGKPPVQRGELRRTTPLDKLFAGKTRLVLGRSPECDICLAHPLVSRHHAALEQTPEGLRLTDLGSVNGVFVGSHRVFEPILVREREHVGIGPFLFSVVGGVLCTIDSSRSVRLEARHLAKVVPITGGTRKLLDDINLAIEPGEFISLLGPSGSGKSTLMDCLNGRRRATSGRVLANGEDFYRHFDSFRQSLGYVPQKDIVHSQLTVYRALYYTARLRLPTDTGPTELVARIEEVIQQMELGPHRETLVANLSGGQIKRVSLGAELLARPCLLYIDEATSGLDAGTEARMMRLFRQLAEEGKSIICITHNVDNVDRCHLVLILARGRLIYFGPPQEAPGYFGVQRVSEIYDRLADKDLAAWEQQFAASSLHRQFIADRLGDLAESPAARTPVSGPISLLAETVRPDQSGSVSLLVGPDASPRPKPRPPLWHQFRILTSRYAELMWGDPRSLRLLLLQAPIVAIFVLAGFIGKPYEKSIPVPRPLTEEEYGFLQIVHAVDIDVTDGTQLSPELHERLARLRFTMYRGGNTSIVNGAQVAELLLSMRQVVKVNPSALDEVAVELDGESGRIKRTLSELFHLHQTLRKANLTKKLLDAHHEHLPVVPDRDMVDPRYTYMLLFLLVVIVLWFGCNNAAKEIVKEEAIYGRERAVNLGILPYLASKFLVLSLITVGQALFLMLLIYGTFAMLKPLGFESPPALYMLAYGPQFAIMAMLAMTGVALGLLLSACVATPDRANALLPYVLIPQIILGGGIMPVKDGVLWFLAAVFSPVYWAYRAVHTGTSELPSFISYHMDYPDSFVLPGAVMLLEIVLFLGTTAWFLKQKDVNRA